MPQIFASVMPHGVTGGTVAMISREITDDLPSDIIGECVTEATHMAWKKGFDPAIEPFVVLVTFR